MARDMFYNYDHQIDKQDYKMMPKEPKPIKWNSSTNMQVIHNIKGDFIGVSAKKNNPIKLYFTFFGMVNGDHSVLERMSDFKFSIVNVLHEPLITEDDVLINATANYNEIEVYIPASNNNLLQDVYRMELSCLVDNENYTLFSENDGVLEIV